MSVLDRGADRKLVSIELSKQKGNNLTSSSAPDFVANDQQLPNQSLQHRADRGGTVAHSFGGRCCCRWNRFGLSRLFLTAN